ncbi:MAG: S-adenosylmethionine:tRNA ribosyltransferase-isomerase, partial [Rhodospirillaceae bacterium]|nr:S-adenosylmethionine:tRNA ribosyltransferase-isomerase [Rhodospirillaceae bacterium]
EWGKIDPNTAQAINKARASGGKVVAVGTTSVRLLETASENSGEIHSYSGETDIFITPGYNFKIVDMMLTNFHTPKSTLFMLVSAFAGIDKMKSAYEHAIKESYRFFSYGDTTLIERSP